MAASIDPGTRGMDVTTPTIEAAARAELDAGRRRFTCAALIAISITVVPFVWILWVLWGPFNPLRPAIYQDNFYDLQTRDVPWTPVAGQRSHRPGGVRARWADLHLLRTVPLYRSHAHPVGDEQSGRQAHPDIPASRLAADGPIRLAAAMASAVPRAWRFRYGKSRSHCIWGLDGHHHGRHDLDASGCDTLCLQRGSCLERVPDHSEYLRPPRCDRATVLGSGDRQWRPHPICQPRPVNHGMGLCGRCRAHRGLVPARSGGGRTVGGSFPFLGWLLSRW